MKKAVKLEGKFAIITSASRWLGREIALDYKRDEVTGLAMVARHSEDLEHVRREVTENYPKTDVFSIVAECTSSKAAWIFSLTTSW